MEDVLKTEKIPEANIYQCWNCKMHSLDWAKNWAKKIIEKGIAVMNTDELRLDLQKVKDIC
jgi:S-ribosylhomocysteine lyase